MFSYGTLNILEFLGLLTNFGSDYRGFTVFINTQGKY
jgi:hypothetical protein